jgi:tRNA-splicing ligase RtcB
MQIETFGAVDDRSLKQFEGCMAAGDADHGVLCADHHPGYSQPIGGTGGAVGVRGRLDGR